MKKAMLFAAGLGTRLRPLTNDRPKALVELDGQTLLERNIRLLKVNGIEELVINVHHFAEKVMEFVKAKDNFGLQIHFSDECEELLETGGGLMKAQPFLEGEEPFVVMNSDLLTNIDLKKMYAFHQEHGGLATLAVRKRASSRKLLFDTKGLLCGWRNEKTRETRQSRVAAEAIPYGFSGIHIINPRIFQLIRQKGAFSITALYLELAKTEEIYAYPHHQDLWFDVGKPDTLKAAREFLEHQKNKI
jgi:NDP-sugar pyrophosphorylase family protein